MGAGNEDFMSAKQAELRPEQCPLCRADLEHGIIVGEHKPGCQLATAESLVRELARFIGGDQYEGTGPSKSCRHCLAWFDQQHRPGCKSQAALSKIPKELL
jgi:hypothetical protein